MTTNVIKCVKTFFAICLESKTENTEKFAWLFLVGNLKTKSDWGQMNSLFLNNAAYSAGSWKKENKKASCNAQRFIYQVFTLWSH